jgi:hypothetical protein
VRQYWVLVQPVIRLDGPLPHAETTRLRRRSRPVRPRGGAALIAAFARRGAILLVGLVGLLLLPRAALAGDVPGPVGAAKTPAPATKPTGPRVAILEMALEGEGAAPAMAMQLQDGFVLGLLRAGIDVIDSADVDKRLAGSPELKGCDSSPCLKKAGQLLAARYALRVKVALSGNSYTMTTRLFSTEGAAPAALPIATLSRSCIVCTVGEARDAMIKLADGMRARIETESAPAAAPPMASEGGGSRLGPLAALAAGVAAVALGAAVVSAAGPGDKGQAALGGTFVGAGLTTSAVALFLALRSPDPTAAAKTALSEGLWTF